MSDSTLQFRSFRDGDESAVVELFDFEYQRGSRVAEWFWAFRANPVGRTDLMLVFEGERLVGELGAVPLQMTLGGRTIAATRLQNLVVHPDVRGRGIFKEATKRLEKHLQANGVELVIGFPNERSFPAFRGSLGYLHVVDLPTWELRAANLEDALMRDVSVVVGPASAMDETDAALLQKEAGNNLAVVRDIKYLNWRYHPASGKTYSFARVSRGGITLGLVVFKYFAPESSVDLMELVTPDGGPTIAVLLKAIVDSIGIGERIIFSTWTQPHHRGHETLVTAGFRPSDHVTHFIALDLSNQGPVDLGDRNSWYLTMGDSDVF